MRSAWYSIEFSRGGIEQADLRSIIGIFSAWILKLILSWVMVPVMTLWKLEVRAHSSCSPWRLFTIFIPLANCKVSWLIAIGWKLRVENSVAEFQHQMPGGSIRPKYRIPLLSIASAADWFGRSSGKLCKYIVIILNLNYYNWFTLVENNKKTDDISKWWQLFGITAIYVSSYTYAWSKLTQKLSTPWLKQITEWWTL